MANIIQLITAHKFEDAIRSLIEDKALMNATALNLPGREGVLHYAACNGNIEFMKYLIGIGGDFDRAAAKTYYMTPMGEAARVGDTEMIRLLYESGARIDGSDASAFSPLMMAAKSAMPSSVKLLLDCGANPNRLGFVQRYFPLDFAGWQKSKECCELIRAANGLSVTDDYDWRVQLGYPIVATVSTAIGAVFPIKIFEVKNKISIRVAQVRKNPRFMYIFTDELHLCSRTELAFFLAPYWGILSTYRDGVSQQSFPVDVLRVLGALVESGQLNIKEGDIFEKSCAPLDNLVWPDRVSALVAINHQFGDDQESWGEIDCPDRVDILVMAPLLAGGNWSKGSQYLKKSVEIMRKVNLRKIVLADPLVSDD